MPLRGDSSLECEQARELTRAFLSGGGVLERRAEWRTHIAACRECDAHYRETVEMIARLHRARRDGPEPERRESALREVDEADESEARAPRRSLIAYSPPARTRWRLRKRSGWLALAIPFVGLLVFATVGMPGLEPRAASVLALRGAATLNERDLAPGDTPVALPAGARIAAAADARVRLQDAASELVLEGEGGLQCEGFAPLRVRLFGGTLRARGPCTISTAVGVVKNPSGALELRIAEDGLHVRAGSAGASFVDGAGARVLTAGEEFAVAARPEPPRSR
jgi:hypothetical protein